ncbi:hypothetical protein Tco_1354822 [Tanacetum coccineum]
MALVSTKFQCTVITKALLPYAATTFLAVKLPKISSDGYLNIMTGNGYGQGEYNDRGWDAPREFTRGRGQGRGRNFRDRGRGGYNNGPYVDDQYDGGYNQEAPPMLQGRDMLITILEFYSICCFARAIDVRKMFSERTDWPHLYWTMDNIIKNDENGVLENSMAIGRLG